MRKYGCVQCYWSGDIPDDCEGVPPDEVCCPDCGFPVYTVEEIQLKMDKLLTLYMAMTTTVYVSI